MSRKLLDHHLISERYFFPRRGALPEPFWVDSGDVRLACYYKEINPTAKTVVHFHGNGEIVDDYLGDFVEIINRMGCNCFLVEFRGYGLSSGVPMLGTMLDDVKACVDALGQPDQNLIFFGRSVGSLFAVEAAANYPDAAGLVLESGVADVLERILLRVHPEEMGIDLETLSSEVRHHFNQEEKIGRFRGPVLVMHTQNDGLVDVSHGERLYQWAMGPKRLEVFPQGTHNDIMYVNARKYFGLLSEFFAGLNTSAGSCFFDQ